MVAHHRVARYQLSRFDLKGAGGPEVSLRVLRSVTDCPTGRFD